MLKHNTRIYLASILLKQKRFKHATPIVLSILGGEQRAERDRVRCQGGARVEPGGERIRRRSQTRGYITTTVTHKPP